MLVRRLPAAFVSLAIVASACGPTAIPTATSFPPGASVLPTPTSHATQESAGSTQPPSPRPLPTPPATPRPTATPFDYAGWIPLSTAGLVANGHLAWAPDGHHLLVVRNEVNGPPSSQNVDVFDQTGNLVQTYNGYDEGFWLDSERIILSTYARRGGGIDYGSLGYPPAVSSIAAVGQQPTEIAVSLAYGTSNQHGAVAVADCVLCEFSDDDSWHLEIGYRIWTADGGLTDVHPGSATAWSVDGDRLVVEHPSEDGPTRSNSRWEIVRWPGLDRYARGGGLLDAEFNMAARWHGGGETERSQIEIVDLPNGPRHTFEDPYLSGNATWDAAGRLVLTEYDSGDATAHALDGSVLEQWDGVGNYVSASPDHAILVFWYWDHPSEEQRLLSILRNGSMSQVGIPGQLHLGFNAVHVSPDGSGMVAVSLLNGEQTALLYRFEP